MIPPSWKSELRLTDLDAEQEIEVTCLRCKKMRYEKPRELLLVDGMKHFYCDQVETTLRCKDRWCKGAVRIALIHDDSVEGFTGGMA